MGKLPLSLAAVLALFLCGAHSFVQADAARDVRVETEKDDKRNLLFKLVNRGDRPVLTRVEHRKACASVSTAQSPRERTYLVHAGQSVRLRKVWAESDCKHSFRILRAAYYERP